MPGKKRGSNPDGDGAGDSTSTPPPSATKSKTSRSTGTAKKSANKKGHNKQHDSNDANGGSTQANNNSNNMIEISESEVDKDIFDEYDPNDDSGLPLRTLLNFTLSKRDDPTQLLTFDEIESNRDNILLTGTLIEPLPLTWRETMLSLLSTTPVDDQTTTSSSSSNATTTKENEVDVDNAGVTADSGENNVQPTTVSTKLDWETLRVNDLVDGYCFQTYKWYEAKIVQIDNNGIKKEGEQGQGGEHGSTSTTRYKVHFQGWNSKYDEWIDKYSERLVPHKASSLIIQEAEQRASLMLPWYDAAELQSRAASKLGKIILNQHRKQVKIRIEDVDDWCVDLTYGNPTLWIVSAQGNWYRIAGALVPNQHANGNPSEQYQSTFQSTKEKYLALSHVTMAILDLFPRHPTANLQLICEEVSMRTKGMMNELYILEYYMFIAEQLKSLALPEGWSSKLSIVKSVFMNQLIKEGEAFHTSGGMTALRNGTYKGAGVKRRKELIQEILLRECPPDVSVPEPTTGKKKRKKEEEPETQEQVDGDEEDGASEKADDHQDGGSKKGATKKEKEPKLSYPVEDGLYWEHVAKYHKEKLMVETSSSSSSSASGISPLCLPMPTSKNSIQLLESMTNLTGIALYSLQEQFMKIYTIASTYRIALKLPIFTMNDLQEAFGHGLVLDQSKDSSNSYLLKELCIAMLHHVIEEKATSDGLETLFGMIVDNHAVNGTNVNTNSNNYDDINTTTNTDPYSNEMWLLPIVCKLREKFLYPSNATAPGSIPTADDLTFQGFLREGDAWEEVLRLLCERDNLIKRGLSGASASTSLTTATSASALLSPFPSEDPILKCDQVLEEIATTFDLSLLNGSTAIKLLRKRLLNGWYDTAEGYCHSITTTNVDNADNDNDECRGKLENFSMLLTSTTVTDANVVNILQKQDYGHLPGQLVDVYHATLKRWFEGIIIDREYVMDRLGNSRTEYYWIRYHGLGFDADERIPIDTDRIVPYKTASNEKIRRTLPPDELFVKFPNIAPSIAKDLWCYGGGEDDVDGDSDDEDIAQRPSARSRSRSRHRGHNGFLEDLNAFIQSRLNYFADKHYEHQQQQSSAVNGNSNNSYAAALDEARQLEEFFKSQVLKTFSWYDQMANSNTIKLLESEEGESLTTARYYFPAEAWSMRLKDKDTSTNQLTKTVVEEMDHSDDATLALLALRHRHRPYQSLSLVERIKLVHWLVGEFVETTFATSYCNEYTRLFPFKGDYNLNKLFGVYDPSSVSSTTENDNAMDVDEEGGNEGGDDAASTTEVEVKVSGRKRGQKAASNNAANSSNTTDAPMTASKKRRTSIESSTTLGVGTSATSNAASTNSKQDKYDFNNSPMPENDIQYELSLSTGRTEPLGQDRFGNLYWSFDHEVIHPSIYIEIRCQRQSLDLKGFTAPLMPHESMFPCWKVYSDPEDIRKLVEWLDEHGKEEASLLFNLIDWIIRNRIVISPAITDSSTVSSFAMNTARSVAGDSNDGDVEGKEEVGGLPTAGTTTSIKKSYIMRRKFRKNIDQLHYDIATFCREHHFRFQFNNLKEGGSQDVAVKNPWEELKSRYIAKYETTKKYKFKHDSSSHTINRNAHHYDVISIDFNGIDQQLGMGVKNSSSNNYVYVTSFKNDTCLAKKSGLLVSDRILFANGIRIDSVAALQGMIKDFLAHRANRSAESNDSTIKKKNNDDGCLLVLIQRTIDPLCPSRIPIDSFFKELYDKDADIHKAYDMQYQQQQQQSNVSSVIQGSLLNDRQPFYPLLQSLFTLFQQVDHPACTSIHWRKVVYPYALSKVMSLVVDIMASCSKSSLLLYQEVCSILLDLETDLYLMGTVMLDLWMDPTSRIRQQWRQLTSSQLFPERLAYTIAMLKAGIDWDLYHHLTVPLMLPSPIIPAAAMSTAYETIMKAIFSESEEMKKIGKYLLSPVCHLLREGTRVLYFGDGHADANHELESYFMNFIGGNCHKRRTVLWGQQATYVSPSPAASSADSNGPPFPGCVWLCQVKQVKLYNALIPFAQITLTVLPFTPSASSGSGTSGTSASTVANAGAAGGKNNNMISDILAASIPAIPKLQSCPNQEKLALARGLERIFHIVKKINSTKQFQDPVNSEEYPEYYDIVKKPIDLNKIERKINNLKYSALNQFVEDMQLLHDNCLLFNGPDDKRYLPIAASVLHDVKTLCPLIFGEDAVLTSEGVNNDVPMDVADDNEEVVVASSNDSEKGVDSSTNKRPRRSFPPPAGSTNSNPTNSMPDSQILPQFEAVTSSPPVKSFTVCMRLDKLNNQFLIEYDKYCSMMKKFTAVKPTPEVTRVSKAVGMNEVAPAKLPKGLLVGAKPLTSPPIPTDGSICFLPWKYLKVDWQEPVDVVHSPYVNPWDVDFLK